jgi:hypothetical protein
MGLYTHCKKSFEKCIYRSCKNQKNDFWDPQDPGREIWLDDCIYLLYSHLYTMYTHFSMKLSNVKLFFSNRTK